ELALVAVGGASVSIATACTAPSGSSPASTIALPDDVKSAGAFAGDVNGDGRPDLLVVSDDSDPLTYVAYGVGDGAFHFAPSSIPASGGDGHFAPQPLLKSAILAAGNLDGDKQADFVTPNGILITAGSAPQCAENTAYGCVYGHRF